MSFKNIRKSTLSFIEKHRMFGAGTYCYSLTCSQPTLYSSCYAAMTRSLYNDLELCTDERENWIDYLNGFQDDDGLFRDPVIYDQGWYTGDPLYCGCPHLTCHVITALACLGGIAEKRIAFLDPWLTPDSMVNWLTERDWGERVAWTGNEIMNIGTLLQYERDFHNDKKAGKSVETLLEWLSTHHINSDTGIWGSLDISDPIKRSHAVQAAYHWWPLFFYDHYSVPCIERVIDTILATQNKSGGFGCGVHNSQEPDKSSACEDIDSIDPLCRMTSQSDYRQDDIILALKKALPWVLKNQMPDGGFVFMLDREFTYGHEQLKGEKNIGAMFPTWFRTLSLALMGQILTDSDVGKIPWHFIRCPGMQFWKLQKRYE